VPAHLLGADVGVARTMPAWRNRPMVEEIRRLTLACIAETKETIYLENQYFTSPLVTEALAARLAEPDGPQVVLITTGKAPSWFDQLTMDRARGAMVWRLKAADIFGRFRAFFPRTSGGADIIVHSKVSVFDDRLVRVGSANLNNRSFGFDTECELGVECEDEGARLNIAAFRDRLVGHFIGATGDAVAKARTEHGGLVQAIDALNGADRLVPIGTPRQSAFGEWVAAYHVGDPTDVSDSWRLGRRRERLFREAREIADQTRDSAEGAGQMKPRKTQKTQKDRKAARP
jgi:phosphatidylserine/phosphatidylglycerophosphate/cardiolipin synthase-like enzyme